MTAILLQVAATLNNQLVGFKKTAYQVLEWIESDTIVYKHT